MALPKTIKIGDKEFPVKDTPELIELIENARKEEKNKLYAEITSLKSALASSNLSEKEVEELKKKYDEAVNSKKEIENELVGLKALHKKAEEEVEKAKVDSTKSGEGKKEEGKTVDFEAKLNEAVDKLTKSLEEKYSKKFTDYEAKIGQLEQSNQSLLVERYKEKILAENKGYIIPELIAGKTVEELDASLKNALDVSKKYITVKDEKGVQKTLEEIEKQKVEDKTVADKKTTPIIDISGFFQIGEDGKPIIARPPKTEQLPEDLLKGVKEMSSDEYAKNRNAIKKQLMAQQKDEE